MELLECSGDGVQVQTGCVKKYETHHSLLYCFSICSRFRVNSSLTTPSLVPRTLEIGSHLAAACQHLTWKRPRFYFSFSWLFQISNVSLKLVHLAPAILPLSKHRSCNATVSHKCKFSILNTPSPREIMEEKYNTSYLPTVKKIMRNSWSWHIFPVQGQIMILQVSPNYGTFHKLKQRKVEKAIYLFP